ncbi:MAG: arsenate reductase ArsC [Pseudomonadales bacterium]|nr:arsenate reductase ArsC [Pseudomonadales bacterium]
MKLLFICTHNRCRSILAEAICRHLGQDQLISASAGSAPVAEVHPLSLKYLSQQGINTDGLRSQSWLDVQDFKPDMVITVCDSAAGESCPLWMGNTAKAHWGLPDPSRVEGTDDQIQQAFLQVMQVLSKRINTLLEYSSDELNRALENPAALHSLFQDIALAIPAPTFSTESL